jgi:hypothetical protein
MKSRDGRQHWCNDFANLDGEAMPETCPDGKPHRWGDEKNPRGWGCYRERDCQRCDVTHEIDSSG